MGALDKQAPAAAAAGLDPAAVRKVERADRRTQLFAVVREAMAQCGFPAEGYRFKVVALDADGWRYLVLVDLAPALEASEADPGPVQGLVAVAAKMRADIVVEGVYWRPAAAEPGAAAPPAAD
jgi:hypothetical protein